MALAQFSIGLEESQTWQRNEFALWCRVKVDQVGKGRSSLLKCDIRERFVRPCQDAVIRDAGMLDHLHIALRYVAPDAVVRRIGMLPGLRRQTTALIGVALHALFGKVLRRHIATGFDVGIMTGNATHGSAA